MHSRRFPYQISRDTLNFDKLSREDLQALIDKILARIAGWRGKLLSYVGKITLIRSCLTSFPCIYCLSLNSLSGL